MREAVVLIHGIWMVGLEMAVLKHRLKACGYPCHQFHYHSLFHTPRRSAIHLDAFLKTIDADIIHIVAHSLGGIVVLHLFEFHPTQKPGRVLMLATPINGSAIAKHYYKSPSTRPLLGKSITRGLLGDAPPWKRGRELGMIAGTRGIGMGAIIFGGLERPNDGTVSISETQSPMINVHLRVPYSHIGMMMSSAVASAICNFLREGDFS